jgi:hypothetical protein
MRGEERRQRAMLMIMEPGERVSKEHPLRRGKELADAALRQLSPLFAEMYSAIGRPLKASLLRLINRPPTPKRGWRRRAQARKRSCVTRPMR